MRNLIAAAALVGTSASLSAQATPLPARPRLPRDADPNDWEAYYTRGVALLKGHQSQNAEALFQWASQLAPQRAEPLYGQFVAYFMRNTAQLSDYLLDDPDIEETPEVRRADSLRLEALQRNPLLFQGYIVLAVDQLPGEWGDDPLTTAWLDYAALRFRAALDKWGRVFKGNPRKYLSLRYNRALAFVGMRAYDSALVEMSALLAELKARQETHLVREWQSEAFLEYTIGLLHAALGDIPASGEAMQCALVEDLSFFQGHVVLGQIAQQRDDAAGAEREYAQAVELSPTYVPARFEYGRTLLRVGKFTEAETQLREAIRLSPYYADPYVVLGDVMLRKGDAVAAVGAYKDYLARAPRNAGLVPAVRQAIERLGGTVEDSTR